MATHLRDRKPAPVKELSGSILALIDSVAHPWLTAWLALSVLFTVLQRL